MILPYLAIALLFIVTVYSAMVSFRQKPEDGAPGWIFPSGVACSARIAVGIATLALLLGLVASFTMRAHHSSSRSFRFLIPENFTGWVRVEFEVPGAPALPREDGQTLLKIPSDGVLRTSSPEQFGWANDSYYSYSAAGLRSLPKSGPGSLVWGKINGEASGSSGKRKYEEFFVGTEQQFKNQLNPPDK